MNIKHTILLIDAEPNDRQSFRQYLENLNFCVLTAEDGNAGLELFERQQPDLVLVDLQIPGPGGLEVLGRLKTISPDTPTIILSGTGVVEEALGALRLGAWDYLLKPITNLEVLSVAVNRNLERARLLLENRRYAAQLDEEVKLRTRELETINQELERTRLQIIHRLGKAAEFKDNESGRHVIRVSLYSSILANAAGLEEEKVQLIHHCSCMHDIGKIGIPDKILLKAGKLDADEWEIAKSHSRIGSQLLEVLPPEELETYRQHTILGQSIITNNESELLQVARKIILYHHEHWDGTGYPEGLKGEEIPIEARIVSVADIYDSLSSNKPYRQARPEEECQAIIRSFRGTFLDPHLVDIFFKCLDQILAIKQSWQD